MSEMAKISKIFIRNVTVLDCAIWHLKEGPLGQSWSVDVEFHGETDHEGVVLDFSAAKKQAKEAIDEHFDHRLLISDQLAIPTSSGRWVCHPSPSTPHDQRFMLETYSSSLVQLPHSYFEELLTDHLGSFEQAIAKTIADRAPKSVKKVIVRLNDHDQVKQPFFFNYLHSLRLHAGNCQRFHGHSNIIEVFKNGKFDAESATFAANYLNKKYLVESNYICASRPTTTEQLTDLVERFEMNSSDYAWACYQGTQGHVVVRLPNSRLLKMSSESTIENIVEWVHQNLFKSSSAVEVRAYEGLHKGAVWP